MDKLLKAANFAAVVHRSQMGEEDPTVPFVNHPIGAAFFLANVGAVRDSVTLQAALLHDTVEWTNTTFDELEIEFGRTVSEIVREVTPEEKGGTLNGSSQLSLAAREVMLADQLWYLKTINEKRGTAELTDSERERFVSTAREIEKYRGTNKAIEDLLDKLFAERNIQVGKLSKRK